MLCLDIASSDSAASCSSFGRLGWGSGVVNSPNSLACLEVIGGGVGVLGDDDLDVSFLFPLLLFTTMRNENSLLYV